MVLLQRNANITNGTPQKSASQSANPDTWRRLEKAVIEKNA
jgi:hypothetical protein